MAVTFSFVRHAESESNVSTADLIGGHNLGVSLSEKGKAQAEALGSFFKEKGVTFTAAYSSTARRTQETASLCFKAMGRDLPLVLDSRLLEQDAGGWEGQSRAIYKRRDVRAALDTDNWNYVPGDDRPGESQKMVADRIITWVREKVSEYGQEGGDPGHLQSHLIAPSLALESA